MVYIFMVLFAVGIVALDQLSKSWVVQHVGIRCLDCLESTAHMEALQSGFGLSPEQLTGLPTSVEGIPGLFRISHTHNTGAAWSSFQGMTWLFALVFAVFTVALIWEFSKKRWSFTTLERWLIVAIYGGGLGNMIDRLRLGFVVDMVELEFMNFPIFNVADCFISCGCIALLVHIIFFNKEFWKDEKK